jgi:uncharacterized protein (DUF1778 family)
MSATSTRRDAVINLRLPAKTRDLIDSAAAVAGKSRTEFVLESVRQHATDVLLDRNLFVLDDDAYEAFLGVLDNPPKPSENLKALFKRKAPWEPA